MPDLRSHHVALDQALARFNAERARLFKDGQPLYVPDELRRRQDALLATLKTTVDAAIESAATEIAEANRAIERAGADPATSLSTDDLQRAAALIAIRTSGASIPLPDLARDAVAALAGNDRAAQYVVHKLGRDRVAEIERNRERLGEQDGRALFDLNQAVESLGAKLADPKGEGAKARKQIEAAQLLSAFANETMLIADGTMDRARAGMDAAIRGAF
jgi:hypothetical protein